jgi:hypothetical protein
MVTEYTISIVNQSDTTQDFFVFQQALSEPGEAVVHSASLACSTLPSYEASGAVLRIRLGGQVHACIQEAKKPPKVGQIPGYSFASRPINLGSSERATKASISPLGLTRPAEEQGSVEPGAFRIITNPFPPAQRLNVGTAVEANGDLMPSSFVGGMPNRYYDFIVRPKFYVQIGSYRPGEVIDFAAASAGAAICDFNGWETAVSVTFNGPEHWSVELR